MIVGARELIHVGSTISSFEQNGDKKNSAPRNNVILKSASRAKNQKKNRCFITCLEHFLVIYFANP